MYALLVMAVLAQPVPQPDVPPPGNAPNGTPPEQVLARIDAKGKLTLVHVSANNGFGAAVQEMNVDVPGKKDEKPAKVKVKITSVTMTTVEIAAKHVEAYTADGNRIEPEKLAKLLAKEKTVLVAMDGKKVDPFHLQLYKDDTIVLVPPANTLNMGVGGGGVGDYYSVPGNGGIVQPDIIAPPPEVKRPDRIKDKDKDDAPKDKLKDKG